MVSGAFNSTDTFQVLSHLEPMDLLRLAMVDKTFQRFLMSKNSAFLWKAARPFLNRKSFKRVQR